MRTQFSVLNLLLALALTAGLALGADISGAWSFTVETEAGSGNPSFVFKQDGEKLTGTYSGLLGKAELAGSVKGDKIEFEFEGSAQGQTVKCRYSGTIASPAQMKGTVQFGDLGSGTWSAVKK